MPYRKPDPALPKLGARLAITRRALDLTRFQMAQLCTDMPTWGTYEDGLVRIPPDEALKLAPHGIPLNWIYEGKMTNLPPHVRAIIRELQRERASLEHAVSAHLAPFCGTQRREVGTPWG